jgi:hypothetical protein
MMQGRTVFERPARRIAQNACRDSRSDHTRSAKNGLRGGRLHDAQCDIDDDSHDLSCQRRR